MHALKRFRLAAVAKQWQAEKQLLTLLRGNLVDYYMDLGEDEKRSLEDVKQALERKAGIKKDPIVAARYFNSRYQDDVIDRYATQLRKAFKEAYPEEDVGSAVLQQRVPSGCHIHHSLVPTEQHRSFGGGLCDLKASRKLELHSQVCDRRLQGLLEATNDLNVEETLNMMSSLKFISKTKPAITNSTSVGLCRPASSIGIRWSMFAS